MSSLLLVLVVISLLISILSESRILFSGLSLSTLFLSSLISLAYFHSLPVLLLLLPLLLYFRFPSPSPAAALYWQLTSVAEEEIEIQMDFRTFLHVVDTKYFTFPDLFMCRFALTFKNSPAISGSDVVKSTLSVRAWNLEKVHWEDHCRFSIKVLLCCFSSSSSAAVFHSTSFSLSLSISFLFAFWLLSKSRSC